MNNTNYERKRSTSLGTDDNKSQESMEIDCSDDTESVSNMTRLSMNSSAGTEDNRTVCSTPTTLLIRKKGQKKSKARGRRKGAASSKYKDVNSSDSKYSYTCMAKEDHGKCIYGVQFHTSLKPGEPLIFATVGSNRVSIYECLEEGSFKILQVYADPDKEEFWTCAWTQNEKGEPLLAAAGQRGIIRIFLPTKGECASQFVGHANAILHLVFHPKDDYVLLSASEDFAMRLWNIRTEICIAILGGVEGHSGHVTCADFDLSGNRIVSGGMDHSLKVWKLNKPEIQDLIKKSNTWKTNDGERRKRKNGSNRSFPTMIIHYPDYSTRKIHENYVDCVKWFGDAIFSKAAEADEIVCWKGGKAFQTWDDISFTTTEITEIMRLEVEFCDLWFLRFSLDFEKTTLALGNDKGKTYIFDLTSEDISKVAQCSVLTHPKCNTAIRQTALSRDGSVLICVCDDATIWRYDLKKDVTLNRSLSESTNNSTEQAPIG